MFDGTTTLMPDTPENQEAYPSNLEPEGWCRHTFPDSIVVREARIYIKQPGFRTRSIVVVTTLLDPVQYPKEELALLYRARWHNEVCQAGYTERSLLYLEAA